MDLSIAEKIDNEDHLFNSAQKGDLFTVTRLLDANFNINAEDLQKRTALHFAAAEGHTDCVKLLVSRGGAVNPVDMFQHTPLDDALLYRRDETARYLRSSDGVSGNLRELEETMLRASYEGDSDMVVRLVSNGVSPNAKDADNRTALLHATTLGVGIFLFLQIIVH